MSWFNINYMSSSGQFEHHSTYVEEYEHAPWMLYEVIEEQIRDELDLASVLNEQFHITKSTQPTQMIQSFKFWENPTHVEKALQWMKDSNRGPMHCHDWIEVLAMSPYASAWIRKWHEVDPESLHMALTLHDHSVYLDCLTTAKSPEEKTQLWTIFSHHVDEIKKDPAALVEITMVHPEWRAFDDLPKMQELRRALLVAQMLESPDIDHDAVPLFVQRQYFTKLATMIECMHDRPALPVSTLSWDF